MDKQSIAVLAPLGALDTQPGIINAVKFLCAAGYQVDVYTIRNLYYPEPNLNPARVYRFPIYLHSVREPRLLVTIAFAVWLCFVLRKRYMAVIAGGVRALVASWFVSRLRPQKVVNLQLELYVGAKLRTRTPRLFKWIERRAIRSASFSIIHDERRARMLVADAGIARERIELLPNAPYGEPQIVSSSFLHEKLGISKDLRLLLAPGSIGPAFCSEELVVAAQELPEGWRCVIHSAQPRHSGDPYIVKLTGHNERGRALFSLSPVPYDRIADVIGSATIGLAVYGEVGGPNTTEVGLASGKLAQFLQLGVPVIVSDYPSLRDFVLRHRVGLPMPDPRDLPSLISEIEADYMGYRERAISAFQAHLSFNRHFQVILKRIVDDNADVRDRASRTFT